MADGERGGTVCDCESQLPVPKPCVASGNSTATGIKKYSSLISRLNTTEKLAVLADLGDEQC